MKCGIFILKFFVKEDMVILYYLQGNGVVVLVLRDLWLED